MKSNIPVVLDKIMLIKDSMKAAEVIIDLENEKFEGDILDIGLDNHGIIYQMCKTYDDELSVDYIDQDAEKRVIEKGNYDVAVLFLAIGKLGFISERRKLIEEVYEYLKDDGEIRIWDVDKCGMRALNLKLKVLLPGNKQKTINVKDFNFMKDSSKETTLKLLEPMFQIVEMNSENNIYCIRGRKIKKGDDLGEGAADSDKC